MRGTPSYFEGRSGCPLLCSSAPRPWTVGSVVRGVYRVCLGCVLGCSIAISYRPRGLRPVHGSQAMGTLRARLPRAGVEGEERQQ